MALDINALRAKLNTFQGQTKRSSAFWRPTEGKSQVRRTVPKTLSLNSISIILETGVT